MQRTQRPGVRIGAVMSLLAAALLACTLSWNSQDSNSTPGASGGGSGAAPVVRILDPASGTRVPVNRQVDITVETDSTATSFLISVGGRVAGTKALPSEESGPTRAILSWMPEREGTFNLEIVAFNGSAASAPVDLLLDVSGTASATGTVSGCTGRVVVASLNFRDAPNTSATRLGQFDLGETVTVVGRNADTTWYNVQRGDGQTVWVINNVQWLPVEGECSALPVVG